MNLLLDRLQASFEREQQFVSDASHELRSPIAAVRAILESESIYDIGGRRSNSSALKALQRLQEVADQLLVLDRGGDSMQSLRPVDVDEWVFTIAERLRGSTNLSIDTASVSGGQVLANEVDIMRIVDNLTSNAARFARTSVKLSLHEQSAWVRFEVQDDGPGIPLDRQAMIFERFGRVDDGRSSSSGGAGLGLAIVKELTDRYGGSVSVLSSPNLETTFVVMLPSARAIP
jgi:signal transduction histidine kinase